MATLDRKEGLLGHRLAAHLLRRASYNYTHDRILEYAEYDVNFAVNKLAERVGDRFPLPIDDDSGNSIFEPNPNISNGKRKRLIENWWLNNALKDSSVGHKMQFFLHTCFTTATTNLFPTVLDFYEHWKLIQHYSIGDYKTFAYKMSIDIFMSKYLNNNNNTVNNPNENYAREILELFTIGKGPQIAPGDYTNYTEHDVQMASKVLTGWRAKTDAPIDEITGLRQATPSKGFHDQTVKVFSHAFDFYELNGSDTSEGMHDELKEFIDMVFAKEETSKFIMRKMYRYFVAREITEEIEADIIEPLAKIFRDNDYKLVWPLRVLLKSKHFFDEGNNNENDTIIGGMVKNPLDYVLGFLSYFKIIIPNHDSSLENDRMRNYNFFTPLKEVLSFMGMDLFSPDQVAGYPAYYQEPLYDRAWVNSQTIIGRYKFGEMMIKSQVLLNTKFFASVVLNMQSYVFGNMENTNTPYLLLRELVEDLFATEIDGIRQEQLTNIFLGTLSHSDFAAEVQKLENGIESDDAKTAFKNIAIMLTKTPEYQLM